MITLRHLKIFIVVADCKKMSEAAKLLYISQPTVSQNIIELEKEYGIKLFERHPKELLITKEGQVLYQYANAIIKNLDDMTTAINNAAHIESLRFGATLTIGSTILCSLLDEFKKEYPDMQLHVEVNNTQAIEQKLMSNEIEVALVEGIIKNNDIHVESVINDCLVLFCSIHHPFAKRDYIELKELQNENIILREKGSGTREMFENYMFVHHLPIHSTWECNSFSAIKQAVIHNYGVSIMSARMLQEDVDKKLVKIVPIKDCSWKRHFYLCYRKNKEISFVLEKFMEKVRTYSTYGILCPYEERPKNT